MTGTAPILRARDLRLSFRGGRLQALDGVNLDVARGSSLAITGASGGGKTTLLHALSGLQPVDAGHVEVAGECPGSAQDWARLRRERIGMIFQDDWLLPAFSAVENVEMAMPPGACPATEARARALALLDRVNAAGFAFERPAGLSGGERQRIAVARSLANAPAILLADEPTGELDSTNAARVADLMFDLCAERGLTLLIVTHDATLAARCETRFVMCDGRGSLAPGTAA